MREMSTLREMECRVAPCRKGGGLLFQQSLLGQAYFSPQGPQIRTALYRNPGLMQRTWNFLQRLQALWGVLSEHFERVTYCRTREARRQTRSSCSKPSLAGLWLHLGSHTLQILITAWHGVWAWPRFIRLTLKHLGVVLGATSKQEQNHNVLGRANIYLNCAFPKVTQQVYLPGKKFICEDGGGGWALVLPNICAERARCSWCS